MSLAVLVLNLRDDQEQYESIARKIEAFPFLRLNRIEAVLGTLLPDVSCYLLTRNKWSRDHKGTLGCFLTHVKAWQTIVESNEPGLILEDDVVLANPESLKDLRIPPDTDIIFCNDRTSYPGDSGLRPILPALPFIAEHGRAVGGDAYIVSPVGASKLLSYVEADSLFAHVDLRLLAYSVGTAEALVHEGLSKITGSIAALKRTYSEAHRLKGLSMSPPIAFHRSEPSRREKQDILGRTQEVAEKS
jgi:GR25 family glycosyltransferase involved in LPS biosynthesis